MGNITDIPSYLVNPDQKDQFLYYLDKLPIPNRRKIELISEWQKQTGLKITKEDIQKFGLTYAI